MNALYAVLAGILFGLGVYAILRRSVIRWLIGMLLLGHAVNLGIFVAGGMDRNRAPILSETSNPVDPLPQALLLTAIVIGFGLMAYSIVLAAKVYQSMDSDDSEGMVNE